MSKKAAATKLTTDICDHKDKKSCDDRKVEILASTEVFENLYSLLEVNEGDVETEDVAGKTRNPSKPVTRVCYGEDPVKDEGPSDTVSVQSWL